MPRAQWPLVRGRPMIEVVLTLAQGGQKVPRKLLADAGAGSLHSPFDILLDEDDCLLCDGRASYVTSLRGAYAGTYPVYVIAVEIPQLGITGDFAVVGVPRTPNGIDGIAGFRFLNRLTYGNFGDLSLFGLES